VARIRKIHAGRITVLGTYQRDNIPIAVFCRDCGYHWDARPNNLFYGKGCPKCAIRRNHDAARTSHQEFAQRVPTSVTLLSPYLGRAERIKVSCQKCGHQWEPVARELLSGCGCPLCGIARRAEKRFQGGQQNFLTTMSVLHPDILLCGPYRGANQPISARCSACDYDWMPRPTNLLKGIGCPRCAGVPRRAHQEFVQEIEQVHNGGIEVLGDYTALAQRVLVRCRVCQHQWEPIANSLIRGHGCPKCLGHHRTQQEFVDAIWQISQGKIEVLGTYQAAATKVEVRCRTCHHIWEATPNNLLRGGGCRECAESGFRVGKPAILYYLRVANPYGKPLYKIGITNRNVAKRFKSDFAKLTVLQIRRFSRGAEALVLETALLSKYRQYRYQGPAVLEHWGNEELFTHDVLGLDRVSPTT
jgi:hypothetical protein